MNRLFTNSEYLKIKESAKLVDIHLAQNRAIAEACGGKISISLLDPSQDKSFIRVSYLDDDGWKDVSCLMCGQRYGKSNKYEGETS